MIQLPFLSTESPSPGLKKRLLFLTPLNTINQMSHTWEDLTWRRSSCWEVHLGSTQCQIFCLGRPRHKNLEYAHHGLCSVRSFTGFITFHSYCLLHRLLFAESAKREAITLSWPELTELVGETDFLHNSSLLTGEETLNTYLGVAGSLDGLQIKVQLLASLVLSPVAGLVNIKVPDVPQPHTELSAG